MRIVGMAQAWHRHKCAMLGAMPVRQAVPCPCHACAMLGAMPVRQAVPCLCHAWCHGWCHGINGRWNLERFPFSHFPPHGPSALPKRVVSHFSWNFHAHASALTQRVVFSVFSIFPNAHASVQTRVSTFLSKESNWTETVTNQKPLWCQNCFIYFRRRFEIPKSRSWFLHWMQFGILC